MPVCASSSSFSVSNTSSSVGSGKGAALSYMNEMGMEKGDEAASAAASKAWAKMQMLNRLGVFRNQNKDDGGDA